MSLIQKLFCGIRTQFLPQLRNRSYKYLDNGLKYLNVLKAHKEYDGSIPHCGKKLLKSNSYLEPKQSLLKYNLKLHNEGLLPRIEGSNPVPMKAYKLRNPWHPHSAQFGINDYIDVLGDGRVTPSDFFKGPQWAKGTHMVFQRMLRQVKSDEEYLKEFEPSKYKLLNTLIGQGYKWANRRRNRHKMYYMDVAP